MKYFIFLYLLLSFISIHAQNENDSLVDYHPFAFVELNAGGNVSTMSLSFGNYLCVGRNQYGAASIGLGVVEYLTTGTMNSDMRITVPYYLTFMVGKSRHFAEFGAGGTFVLGPVNKLHYFYPMLGYRFYPLRRNKFHFRLYGSLSNIKAQDNVDVYRVGCSVGFSF